MVVRRDHDRDERLVPRGASPEAELLRERPLGHDGRAALPGVAGLQQPLVEPLVAARHLPEREVLEHSPRGRSRRAASRELPVTRRAARARRRTRPDRGDSISDASVPVHELAVARQRRRDHRHAHGERLVDHVRHALEAARHQQQVAGRVPRARVRGRRMEAHLGLEPPAPHQLLAPPAEGAPRPTTWKRKGRSARLRQACRHLDHQQRVLLLDEPSEEEHVGGAVVESGQRRYDLGRELAPGVDARGDHLHLRGRDVVVERSPRARCRLVTENASTRLP